MDGNIRYIQHGFTWQATQGDHERIFEIGFRCSLRLVALSRYGQAERHRSAMREVQAFPTKRYITKISQPCYVARCWTTPGLVLAAPRGRCRILVCPPSVGPFPLVSFTSSSHDYSPTATSRVTHVAQCVVFGAVMSDAAMLDAVLSSWMCVEEGEG